MGDGGALLGREVLVFRAGRNEQQRRLHAGEAKFLEQLVGLAGGTSVSVVPWMMSIGAVPPSTSDSGEASRCTSCSVSADWLPKMRAPGGRGGGKFAS